MRMCIWSRKAGGERQNSSATIGGRAGRTEFLAVNVKKTDALHEEVLTEGQARVRRCSGLGAPAFLGRMKCNTLHRRFAIGAAPHTI